MFLACLILGCNRHAAVPSTTPTKFSAKIGGFEGQSAVELTAPDTLIYLYNSRTFTSNPGTERTTIKVTEAQWQKFRARLDAAKVWTWKADYIDPGVMDGLFWSFHVDFGDKKINCLGSNAYPEQAQFDAMLAAVRELLGGKSFK